MNYRADIREIDNGRIVRVTTREAYYVAGGPAHGAPILHDFKQGEWKAIVQQLRAENVID